MIVCSLHHRLVIHPCGASSLEANVKTLWHPTNLNLKFSRHGNAVTLTLTSSSTILRKWRHKRKCMTSEERLITTDLKKNQMKTKLRKKTFWDCHLCIQRTVSSPNTEPSLPLTIGILRELPLLIRPVVGDRLIGISLLLRIPLEGDHRKNKTICIYLKYWGDRWPKVYLSLVIGRRGNEITILIREEW